MASDTFTFYVQPWYRKSPYFEATKRHGCKSWGLYNHMLLPTLYDDPVTEYEALLHDVTLWDVAVERNVEVTGPDGFRFAQLLTCREQSRNFSDGRRSARCCPESRLWISNSASRLN